MSITLKSAPVKGLTDSFSKGANISPGKGLRLMEVSNTFRTTAGLHSTDIKPAILDLNVYVLTDL